MVRAKPSTKSEVARSSECTEQYAQKVFDNADIVRDAIFRQLTVLLCAAALGSVSPGHGVALARTSTGGAGKNSGEQTGGAQMSKAKA